MKTSILLAALVLLFPVSVPSSPSGDAVSMIATREFEFIKRHGLLKQFQNEDATGQWGSFKAQ